MPKLLSPKLLTPKLLTPKLLGSKLLRPPFRKLGPRACPRLPNIRMVGMSILLGTSIFLGSDQALAGPNADGVPGARGEQAGTVAASTGPGSASVMQSGGGLGCGIFLFNADETYENGYVWRYGGIARPYYGAFAEGYVDSPGTPCSAVFDFTTTGTQNGQLMDVYIWEDASGIPGAVISVTTDVDPGPVAFWPSVSRHVVPIVSPAVGGDFWVGYWGNWPDQVQGWFIAVDLDGPGGLSFTNIAPGIGYPTGWRDVEVVWGPTQALGIGVELSDTIAGACCLPDGTCLIRLEEDCTGTFLGEGTDCQPNECPPPPDGACCLEDGSCLFVNAFICSDLGGNYLGDGLVCDPNPCPPPPDGACCFVDGTCLFIDRFACADAGGTYLGDDLVCDPNPCDQPDLGACCFFEPETCEDLLDYQCEQQGGHFLGGGTSCSTDECAVPCNAPLIAQSPPENSHGHGRGPNAGGTLILHYDGIEYTSDQSDYCGQASLADCSSAVTRVDDDAPVVFHVYAAFPGESRLAGVTFGVYYADCFIVTDYGSCGDFELPDGNWPESGTGTAVTWSSAQTDQLVEIYWFAGYVDGGQASTFSVGPHPQGGGNFADDDVPSNIDPIAGYGVLGFDTPGSAPCPSSEQFGACCFPDGSCMELFATECEESGGSFQGEGTSCKPTDCSGVQFGACCFSDGSCVVLTEDECSAHGGVFLGDDTTCDPNPCSSTPLLEKTWGEIKVLFR